MNLTKKKFIQATIAIILFVAWTLAVQQFDLQAIGPNESIVGFATINGFVHNLLGVHMFLYNLTDFLSILPLAFVPAFAVIGLYQLIQRKSLLKVDYDILVLGGFYAVVIAVFLLFEVLVINYRPVLIEGVLEASYPSSTTMLVLCVMPTAVMQLNNRLQNQQLKKVICSILTIFTLFMVVARLVSGVHWFSDIVGGILISIGLVTMYSAVCDLKPIK